jgi:predicted dehydrogenase
MTEPALRVGLVGLGGVAIAHLEGYRQLDDVRVIAGADVVPDRARLVAERYGFTPYTDYRELLDRERPDVVCVLSSVNSHCEVVLAAADRGIHVLCEKPLAVTLDDADRMIARCRERGVLLFYAASYRFLPPLVAAREIIASGRIGRVQLLMETLVGGRGIEGYQPMGFVHYPAGGPGGSGWGLVDHGIHLVDIFGWLMSSDVVAVQGRGQISGEPPAPEHMTMTFANGATGVLLYDSATWSSDLPQEGLFSWAPVWDDVSQGRRPSGAVWDEHPSSIRIHGTEGALRVYHYANQLFLRTAAGVEQIRVDDRPMPAQFAAEMASFASSIRSGRPPAVTGDDGRRALRAVLGVYRSMETGTRFLLD